MTRTGRECRIKPIPSLLCLTQWAPTPAGSQRQLSKSGFECQLSFQESNQRNLLETVTHESITTTSPSPSSCRAFTLHLVTIPLSCRALTRHPGTCRSTTLLRSTPRGECIWIPAFTGMTRTGRECRINPIPSLLCLTQWAPTPAGSQPRLSKSGFECQLSFQKSNPKKSSRNRNTRINHHHFTTPSSCRALTRHPVTIPFVMPRLHTAPSHHPLVMPCFDTASSDALQHNLITGVHP